MPIRLGLIQESSPDRYKSTQYEREGYGSGTAQEERKTRCRVTDQVSDSWICLKHGRHIVKCLNKRVEEEVLELRRLRSQLLRS